MSAARPTPAEVVDELAARMTLPPPTGNPAPFVRAACSCVVVSHPAGRVWCAMTQDRSCPEHVHGERWSNDQNRPEETSR